MNITLDTRHPVVGTGGDLLKFFTSENLEWGQDDLVLDVEIVPEVH